ncbi:reverse transcriptase domain-containing protein [Tanacetum coccineum]
MQDLLRTNVDVFVWTYAAMTRILRTIMVERNPFNTKHRLNEHKYIEPVKKKKRGLALMRNEAACEVVEELLKADIRREVKYQTWVVNPVMMTEGDEDKTTFFPEKGVFCYRKMPCGLKNVGATYQRLIDKVFSNQIGQNIEAYVDDIVIKSSSEEDMLIDIQETFDKLRSINMKLNPKKCSFGIEEGSLLGHLITKQGIKANLMKVKRNLRANIAKNTQGDINIEELQEDRTMDSRRRRGLPKNERVYGDIANAYGPNQRRTIDNVSRSFNGKHMGCFAREKRKNTSSYLLRAEDIEVKKTKTTIEESEPKDKWKLYTDGTSSFYGLGAVDIKVKDLSIFVDSQLVVKQVKGHFEARQPVIKQYLDKTKQIHSSILRKPKQETIPITSAWPFSQWRIKIVGPLPMAPRRTPKSSNGETPFSLTYGSKSIIPIEISMETKRIKEFEGRHNEKRHREDLDTLEERRKIASISEAHYKQKLERYYNRRVRPSTFKRGTYVLRPNNASKAEFQGKIGPIWEGPYVVTKSYGDGAYKLETLSGSLVYRTWNGSNLREFYM